MGMIILFYYIYFYFITNIISLIYINAYFSFKEKLLKLNETKYFLIFNFKKELVKLYKEETGSLRYNQLDNQSIRSYHFVKNKRDTRSSSSTGLYDSNKILFLWM